MKCKSSRTGISKPNESSSKFGFLYLTDELNCNNGNDIQFAPLE